eukprot:Gb_32354 [translate_table: standard]
MTLHLGIQTTVVVSSPVMAKEFLSKNDNIFSGRTVKQPLKAFSFHQSSIAWSQYGPRWRMLRRICNNELFSTKRMEALQHLRRDQVFGTMQLIHDHYYAKGKSVDIGQTIFISSFNLLGNMIFSQNVLNPHSEAADEFKETVWKVMKIVGAPNLADFFPFLQFLDPWGLRRDAERCMVKVYALVDKFIEIRLASRSQKSCSRGDDKFSKDFLDVLLDFRGNGKGEVAEFSRSDIKAVLFDLFLAGSETMSATIEWTMAEMVRNTKTMKRLQAELDDVVGRDRRASDKACDVGGYLIPQRSQGNDEMDYKGHNFELIPFGAGRRICVGLPLATPRGSVSASLLPLATFGWTEF